MRHIFKKNCLQRENLNRGKGNYYLHADAPIYPADFIEDFSLLCPLLVSWSQCWKTERELWTLTLVEEKVIRFYKKQITIW